MSDTPSLCRAGESTRGRAQCATGGVDSSAERLFFYFMQRRFIRSAMGVFDLLGYRASRMCPPATLGMFGTRATDRIRHPERRVWL